MDLAAVVAQLKTYAPIFGGRIAGAADFATGLESSVWQELPAAYVIPLDDAAAENDEQNSLRQVVTETIGIVVEFDNSSDRRGQTVTLAYDAMRSAIWAALLNWHIDPLRSALGLAYGGGHLLQLDRARLFYQYEFKLIIQIDESDGFKIAAPPLLTVEANADPGDPWIAASVTLPQE